MSKTTKSQTRTEEAIAEKPQSETHEAAAQAPQTLEAVAQEVDGFLGRADDLKRAIENDLRAADDIGRQVDELREEAGRLESVGQVDEGHATLKKIGPLRERRQQLLAGVGKYAEQLRQLLQEEQAVRTCAHRLFFTADSELEAAQQRRNKAAATFGAVSSHALSEVREILSQWRKRMGIAEPPARTAQEPPAKPQKPACPRCRKTQYVEQLGEGRWKCGAVWHGPVIFNGAGQVLQARGVNVPKRRDAAAVA